MEWFSHSHTDANNLTILQYILMHATLLSNSFSTIKAHHNSGNGNKKSPKFAHNTATEESH